MIYRRRLDCSRNLPNERSQRLPTSDMRTQETAHDVRLQDTLVLAAREDSQSDLGRLQRCAVFGLEQGQRGCAYILEREWTMKEQTILTFSEEYHLDEFEENVKLASGKLGHEDAMALLVGWGFVLALISRAYKPTEKKSDPCESKTSNEDLPF